MWKVYLSAALSGAIFALGLVLSGMTQPAKIVAFLDFFGDWNPSLLLVMGGALLVHMPLLYLVRKRQKPVLDKAFSIPTSRSIDGRLVLGASLFGVGWGLSGYCPGPAWVGVASFAPQTWVFVAAMLGGMYLCSFTQRRL